jgi:hypothetical protein
MRYDIQPYDPCPCGSGNKYKFCCAARAKGNRRGKFPIGTVAFYGPDDKTTTKIAAAVILSDAADPILQRWVATNVADDPAVAHAVREFFARHGVKSVVVTSGNFGCPHEEGEDFPAGEECPFCPYWAGKQGIVPRDAKDLDDDDDEDENAEDLEADLDGGDLDEDKADSDEKEGGR